jgi:putative intracellular protease/amidase
MADLVDDADLGRLLTAADTAGTVIGALCHGVGGLLSAHRADGSFTFAGRTMTAFSNAEEGMTPLRDNAPFLIESRLRELGAEVTPGPPFSSTVVVDGNLITGQNPPSSVATAERFVAAL